MISAAAGPEPFDVCGPLPEGTTVLEASAGTGKTYTIAALAARYVAEGRARLADLLLVTFGRMASNELRVRVRDRLVTLEAALQAGAPAPADPVEALLCSVPEAERAERRNRVARALAEFDDATIATTHEFCLRMLDGLGVLGDREPEARFVEEVTELTREVATDTYLARYAAADAPPMTVEEAGEIATAAVSAVHARLVPEDDPSPAVRERTRYARAVREEVERRKRVGRLLTYDDMLTRLRDALAAPVSGVAAAERLRRRYQVVLVDEFQDTDPIQWEILHRAFHGAVTLVLIGDPKQAIYAFRGADVFSYLSAVREADRVQTLAVNRRSDQALLDALGGLIGGAALGERDILVRPVQAFHTDRRLHAAGSLAPLRLRVIRHPGQDRGFEPARRLRQRIAADLVADVTALLADRPELDSPQGRRPLRPADIAVLVRKNERGEAIRDALVAAGVPAVMVGAASVFASAAAEDWLVLLAALDAPRQQAVRQVALTRFVGWTFERLALASEADLVELSQRVRGWSRLLAGRGVAALLEAVSREQQLVERVLGTAGGERTLTDVRHLGERLHAAMTAGRLGTGALLEWLRGRMAEARRSGDPEGTRRLDTDEEAVTVLTVHRSKGLEFPVVYLPEAWDRWVDDQDRGRVLQVHETGADGSADCVLDVGGRFGAGRSERRDRWQDEEGGEDLRLCYVALTRAQCAVVAWWAPGHTTRASALHRLLLRDAAEESPVPRPGYSVQGDPFDLAPRPGLCLEEVVPREPVNWRAAPARSGELGVRRFDRVLDLSWRRTSYSALTAAVHGQPAAAVGVGSEPEAVREDDEPAAEESQPRPAGVRPEPADPWDRVSPMAGLPAGTAFGTAVHAVFETVDPTADDLAARLREASTAALSLAPPGAFPADELAAALLPVCLTPLGPLAGERRLADLGPQDRLAELGFEYPLGRDRPIPFPELPALLRRHLPADDPLAGYADRLDDPVLAAQSLRGFLNGSIDAVLRVREPSGPRFLVVDYKTNWLGDGEGLTLRDYRPERMAEAMMAAHYPLQALLYAVAVHRMLRWRLPGYRPDRHLGGVLYLFVRGMAGPDTPRADGVPAGVFSWRPPADLVTELSDLLAGAIR